MGVAGAGDVLGGGAVLEGEGGLGDHLAGVGADDVAAQQPVRLGVGQHLDHALRVEVGLGSRVGAEGERPGLVRDVGLLELLLVLPHPRHLRVRVHHRRDHAVVDVAVPLLDPLDGRHGLLLGLVREHGSEGHIADGSDVRGLGAVLRVDDDAAALVHLETNVLETEAGSVGSATDGDEDHVSIELLRNYR